MTVVSDSARVDGRLGRSVHRATEAAAVWVSPARVVAVVLAAIPAIRMTLLVREGTRVPFADYWMMLPSFLRSDGWLNIGGLGEMRNEHPLVLPKVLYWLNALAFDGNNITLGYFVVFVVVAQVIVIGLLVRDTQTLHRWSKVAVVVAASALLFSRQGAWNFLKSMSGAGWLTANLFALATLIAHRRGHRVLALCLAVLATLSYGSGLAVFPALILMSLLSDGIRRTWPTIGVTAFVFAGYLAIRMSGKAGHESANGATQAAKNAATVIGAFFTGSSDGPAPEIGFACIVVGVILAAVLLRRGRPDEVAWVGMFVYALGAVGLIAVARTTFLSDFASSRYASLAALVWLSVFAMALIVLSEVRVAALLALPLIVGSWAAGSAAVGSITSEISGQDQLSIALSIDRASGSTLWTVFQRFPDLDPTLRSTGHLPFDGTDLGCGLFGERLRSIARDSEVDWGELSDVTPLDPTRLNATNVRGEVATSRGPIRCVVVTDDQDRVVGAASTGTRREGFMKFDRPGFVRFRGLAQPGVEGLRVYVRVGDDESFHRLPAAGS